MQSSRTGSGGSAVGAAAEDAVLTSEFGDLVAAAPVFSVGWSQSVGAAAPKRVLAGDEWRASGAVGTGRRLFIQATAEWSVVAGMEREKK